MPRPFATTIARLDAIYRDRMFFDGMKARLLAGFIFLLLVFVPFNVLKLLWVNPPDTPARLVINLLIVGASLLALRFLFAGKLETAGNALVLQVDAEAAALEGLSVQDVSEAVAGYVEGDLVLGPVDGAMQAVIKGVSPGELVVTEGVQKVRPGQVVDATEVKPEA
mgnify:CR=1 FL=1